MKKDKQTDELRDEYDFERLSAGERGKHADRYGKGTNLVRLDDDVARAFATDEAVNQALRKLLEDGERAKAE